MKTVKIPYKPRDYQREVHDCSAQFRVVVWHRRCGKTICAINELIRYALTHPKTVNWYVAPTYRQAKMIVWEDPDMLSKYLPDNLVVKKNASELTVKLVNGSVIAIKGADNPDSLRGANPQFLVLDEYGDMKKDVWDAIFRPILTENKGKAIFIGTPKGKNHFHRVFRNGVENIKNWDSFYLSASTSKVFTDEELSEVRAESTEHLFKQEYECYWHDSEGTVFRRIRENATSAVADADSSHLYYVGVDLGRHQDWTVISVIDRTTHQQVYFDRFNQIDWGLQKAKIEAVARRFNNAQIIIDRTGVGDPIEEELTRAGLSVEGFGYSNTSKKHLIEILYQ